MVSICFTEKRSVLILPPSASIDETLVHGYRLLHSHAFPRKGNLRRQQRVHRVYKTSSPTVPSVWHGSEQQWTDPA